MFEIFYYGLFRFFSLFVLFCFFLLRQNLSVQPRLSRAHTPPADSQVLGSQAHATIPRFVFQFSPALCWEDCEVSVTSSWTSCFWGLKPPAASMVGLLPAPPVPLQLPFQLVHPNMTTSLCQIDGHFVQAYHCRTLVACAVYGAITKGPWEVTGQLQAVVLTPPASPACFWARMGLWFDINLSDQLITVH